jgi:hypothetical protein
LAFAAFALKFRARLAVLLAPGEVVTILFAALACQ